jgi:hypothetical protein
VGEKVTPWLKYPGGPYAAGTSAVTVAADGTFAWSRKTNKRIYVSFSHGLVRSNIVAIPARRD